MTLQPFLIIIAGCFATVMVTLLSWILSCVIGLKIAMAETKLQLHRLASDVESEKRGRSNHHKEVYRRLVRLERIIGNHTNESLHHLEEDNNHE